MRKLLPILSFFILHGNLLSAQGQQEEKLFKPTISPGVGILTFYGDVGRDNQGYSPLNGRPAVDLRLSLPVTNGLDINFDAMFGRLAANERFSDRNLNFISDIKAFSAFFTYDFYHLRKPGSKVAPYVSVGVTAFDFLTRSDLLDSNGNPYFFWNDGTIRDIAQNSPNAGSAEIIMRNYNFESGVRDLDIDGFGLYRQSSYAIPVGIGFNMSLTPHVGFRMGSTLYLTFTDLIDNVTNESLPGRAGNNRNDFFLYTNAAVTINLNPDTDKDPANKRIYAPTLEEKNELLAIIVSDSDRDGVRDIYDECPNTPAGVEVDEKGCPLDRDGDGIPDYLDKQPDSPLGAFVDKDGVALTDEDFLRMWQMYTDSTGQYTAKTITSTYTGTQRPQIVKTERPLRTFAVRVGESTTGISPDEVDFILSIPDVRTIQKGDTTLYVIGSYDNLPEAVKRKFELDDEGIEGSLIAREDDKILQLTDEERKEAARAIAKEQQIGRGPLKTKGVVYRVQLGAFKFQLSKNIFADVSDLVVIPGDDGITRYSTGSFNNLNDAVALKTEMVTKGFEGAFVTAYRDGKRIKLSEAGATYTSPDVEETPTSAETPGAISTTGMKFLVQLGAFRERVPADILNSYIVLGGVKPRKDAGLTKYVYGIYDSYEQAQAKALELREKGYEGAFVVAEFNNQVIPAKDALNLRGE
jgi:hypothetical protein